MASFSVLIPARPRLVVPVLAALGLTWFAVWATFDGGKPPPDARCEAWDSAARTAVAGLITVRDPVAERYFGDAVLRLRRARVYCRFGWVDLALLDYKALMNPRYAGRNGRVDGMTARISQAEK